VTAARKPKSESIIHNTKYDWDFIVTIQDLIVRWCNGIAFCFHWDKEHSNLINLPLPRDERLNIYVNTSGKAGAQILHLPSRDDSSPRGR
jgi:hypothetical protein